MLKHKLTGTFLVTGSSSGIGKAIADSLSKNGVKVIYHSRILHNIDTNGSPYLIADLSHEKEVDELASKIETNYGPLDGIVCCAGRTHLSGGEDTSLTFNKIEFTKIFDNILFPVTLVCSRLVPKMIQNNKGKVVIIGGDVVDKPNKNSAMCCYAMAKAAVHQYALYLAAKTRNSNITVNVVSPTGIEPIRQVPPPTLNRKGTKEEVADLVSFLCSEQASFISGQIIRLNGGKLNY